MHIQNLLIAASKRIGSNCRAIRPLLHQRQPFHYPITHAAFMQDKQLNYRSFSTKVFLFPTKKTIKNPPFPALPHQERNSLCSTHAKVRNDLDLSCFLCNTFFSPQSVRRDPPKRSANTPTFTELFSYAVLTVRISIS